MPRDDRTNPIVEAQIPQEASKECAGVVVGVEADQVGTEHALKDRPVARQETEHIVRRERDVEEESDPGLGNPVADQARQEEEMVVVDPKLILWGEGLHDRVRELRVDGAVRLPFRGRVSRVRGKGVKQRPQGPIRKAGVVRAGQGGRKNHGNAIELFLESGGDLLGFAWGDGAGPSEPASLQFSMKGGEARRDSAGIRLHVEAASPFPQRRPETVPDDAESPARQRPVTDHGAWPNPSRRGRDQLWLGAWPEPARP